MTSNLVRLTSFAPLLLTLALVIGCGDSGPTNEKVTPENWKKVQPGMKLSEIEAILGPSEPGTAPKSADQPEDAKLTWKKWKRSSRGPEVFAGFDSKNEAELVDWPKEK